MGILDYFKKKKVEEKEIELEEIRFEAVGPWIDEKLEEVREKEKEIFVKINSKIDSFSSEIDVKIDILKKINIEEKKEVGRTKMIVRQSLDNYVKHVYIFKKELGETKKGSVEEFIGDVNKVFSRFEKNSFLFYERATYLVGDEMVAVKKEISNLSRELKEIFEEDKKILNESRKISKVNSILDGLKKNEIAIENVNSELVSLDKEVESLKDRKNSLSKEIGKVRSSEETVKSDGAKEKVRLKEKELVANTFGLKALIDFKKLTNVHHSSNKDMDLVKGLKENFQKDMEKDKGENLFRLLEEAGILSSEVKTKIENINEVRGEILGCKSEIIKDKTVELNNEIKNLDYKVESLGVQKSKYFQKIELMKENKKGLVDSLKEEAKEIGAIISY